MNDELEARAEALASEAECDRCETLLMADASMIGTVFVRAVVPGVGSRRDAALCGRCGLLLQEFLTPALAVNPRFQEIKAEVATW